MTATVTATRMPRVFMAFVDDFYRNRIEYGEVRAHRVDTAHVGNVFLNGLTLTCA